MRKNGWKPETAQAVTQPVTAPEDAVDENAIDQLDLEDSARDQIANLIQAKFSGHSLTRLVDAILRAQG